MALFCSGHMYSKPIGIAKCNIIHCIPVKKKNVLLIKLSRVLPNLPTHIIINMYLIFFSYPVYDTFKNK